MRFLSGLEIGSGCQTAFSQLTAGDVAAAAGHEAIAVAIADRLKQVQKEFFYINWAAQAKSGGGPGSAHKGKTFCFKAASAEVRSAWGRHPSLRWEEKSHKNYHGKRVVVRDVEVGPAGVTVLVHVHGAKKDSEVWVPADALERRAAAKAAKEPPAASNRLSMTASATDQLSCTAHCQFNGKGDFKAVWIDLGVTAVLRVLISLPCVC